MKRLAALLVAGLAVVAVAAAQAAPPATVVYDNIPSPQPGNVFSQAFEATQTSEFGGQIQLAGTARQNPTVTVLMSSWGCQTGHWYSGDCVTTPGATFTHPITLNVYAVGTGGSVGPLIATSTMSLAIPYRPSASPSCGDGRWSNGTSCFNGFAAPISFDLTGALVGALPNKVIVSVAYNTTHYGYAPIGEAAPCYSSPGGCGYDSLNVGLNGSPTVGSDPQPADAYLNSTTGGQYCDLGAAGVGTFRLDAGCWLGFQPAIRVTAVTIVGPPTSKDQCKNDGWKAFNNPTFKNQGDCVSYVTTGGSH